MFIAARLGCNAMPLVFVLPYPLKLPNREGIAATRGGGAAKIRRVRTEMAWEVAAALAGVRPAKPIRYARVQVFRHSVGVPDRDNLFTACNQMRSGRCQGWQPLNTSLQVIGTQKPGEACGLGAETQNDKR